MSREQFFQELVGLLNEFKWIYDFQMTEIFCDSKFEKNFPVDVSKKPFIVFVGLHHGLVFFQTSGPSF